MINTAMALNFSVRNNPGVYALLLGSGVSYESEVPTGWGILQDLIRKVAAIEGEDPDPDPIEWYREKYGDGPGYDDILETLAHSKEERQALLEPYFEPTDEEREQGVKTPSDAHRNIAWLVDEGYIDVIVTTNFDRLLEQALQDRGVTPTVISTAAAAEGATPFNHKDAVILKVNGDYKETNIKNTSSELEVYDPSIRRLLDKVFDEYGLVVCGWSGKWDTALRNAILECESRRYSTFWAYHGELEDEAEELIEHRDGTAIKIDGASQFFTELKANVQALEDAEDGAPLTREVARERVKRYMTREERKIDLADLIQDETERARNRVFDENRFPLNINFNGEAVEERLNAYETAIKTLVVACSTCAYWGPEVANPASKPLCDAVRRLGTVPSPNGTYKRPWNRLQKYPSTFLMYGIGVPAVVAEDWDLIYQSLIGTDVPAGTTTSSTSRSAILALHPSRFEGDVPSNMITSGTIVVKNRLKEGVRNPMRDFIPDDDRYDDAFFRFEALTDLVVFDRCMKSDTYNPFIPDTPRWGGTMDEIMEEVEAQGEDWGPLQAGLFDRSLDQLRTVLDEFA